MHRVVVALVLCLVVTLGSRPPMADSARAEAAPDRQGEADLALVVSVDVSESVDDHRYALQMDGIAKALEDPAVISSITSGPKGAIYFAMVAWADRSEVAVPWVHIAGREDAERVAARVRGLKRYGGEFTCLARMLRSIHPFLVSGLKSPPARVVVDVSGDGIDNCGTDEATRAARDELVAAGVTINGLPIIEEPDRIVGSGAYRAPGGGLDYLRPLESREQLTLEDWYRAYVMGGDHSFILPANGYADFARAMRQKFVTEISGIGPTPPGPGGPSGRATTLAEPLPGRRIARR